MAMKLTHSLSSGVARFGLGGLFQATVFEPGDGILLYDADNDRKKSRDSRLEDQTMSMDKTKE